MFTSLRQVFHSMDKASFQDLATHILKGNQVIVRGNNVALVTSLIGILKVSYEYTPHVMFIHSP